MALPQLPSRRVARYNAGASTRPAGVPAMNHTPTRDSAVNLALSRRAFLGAGAAGMAALAANPIAKGDRMPPYRQKAVTWELTRYA